MWPERSFPGAISTPTCRRQTACQARFGERTCRDKGPINGCPHSQIAIAKELRAGNRDVLQTSLHNPDLDRNAKLCGALAIRITSKEDLDAALQEALTLDGPATVEILTDADLISLSGWEP